MWDIIKNINRDNVIIRGKESIRKNIQGKIAETYQMWLKKNLHIKEAQKTPMRQTQR